MTPLVEYRQGNFFFRLNRELHKIVYIAGRNDQPLSCVCVLFDLFCPLNPDFCLYVAESLLGAYRVKPMSQSSFEPFVYESISSFEYFAEHRIPYIAGQQPAGYRLAGHLYVTNFFSCTWPTLAKQPRIVRLSRLQDRRSYTSSFVYL